MNLPPNMRNFLVGSNDDFVSECGCCSYWFRGSVSIAWRREKGMAWNTCVEIGNVHLTHELGDREVGF